MTTALDPLTAVEYLRLLSCDLMTAGVSDPGGEWLAGGPPDAALGTVVSVNAGLLTIEVTTGDRGSRRLLDHDLETVRAELSA